MAEVLNSINKNTIWLDVSKQWVNKKINVFTTVLIIITFDIHIYCSAIWTKSNNFANKCWNVLRYVLTDCFFYVNKIMFVLHGNLSGSYIYVLQNFLHNKKIKTVKQFLHYLKISTKHKIMNKLRFISPENDMKHE